MGEPPLRTPQSEDRLDSWKEIAAYLKRDVRTVQRWEKREGMPVHRHQHDKLGSVYALRDELDAWTETRRSCVDEPETKPDVEAPPISQDQRTSPRAWRGGSGLLWAPWFPCA
jgi:phage terminase Nu1 subunit (DNA packaging protein)